MSAIGSAFTEDQIAYALATLKANGGSYERAARDLSAEWGRKVPRQYIHRWANGIQGRVSGDAATARVEATKTHESELAARSRRLAKMGQALQEMLVKEALADPERRKKLNIRDVATMTGINIDKYRLLEERPTSIKADADLASFLHGLSRPAEIDREKPPLRLVSG